MSHISPVAGSMFGVNRGGSRGQRRWYQAAGLPWWAGCLLSAAPAAIPAVLRAFFPAGSRQEEYEATKEQVKYLENTLEQARKRVKELEEKEQE
jgi:hypothetical protein